MPTPRRRAPRGVAILRPVAVDWLITGRACPASGVAAAAAAAVAEAPTRVPSLARTLVADNKEQSIWEPMAATGSTTQSQKRCLLGGRHCCRLAASSDRTPSRRSLALNGRIAQLPELASALDAAVTPNARSFARPHLGGGQQGASPEWSNLPVFGL
jgi:hypothetical protein